MQWLICVYLIKLGLIQKLILQMNDKNPLVDKSWAFNNGVHEISMMVGLYEGN